MRRARVRGIYATALTQLLLEAGVDVVQPSDPIRERFDEDFDVAPTDVHVRTTRDRQGVEVSGDPDGVEAVVETVDGVGIDTFAWEGETPRGGVYDGEVVETGGSGAVVDLGDGREGFLRYDAADGYVDDGDRYRVQVHEPTPPWSEKRPLVDPEIVVGRGFVTLTRGGSGVSADVRGERATELVRTTELLSTDVPDGWGVTWRASASEASLESKNEALADAVERAEAIESALGGGDPDASPGTVVAPESTAWVWFGRESRFALDELRRTVATTMPGHHRIKAGTEAASGAVDFVEAVCEPAGSFPFDAVSRQFGPREGDRVAIVHGKPDGRCFTLGRGRVTDCDPDGKITVRRTMRGGGTYDALGAPKREGDVAITKLTEGRWWYPTVYQREGGETVGTYVNVCTPVECFPDAARYVDLHVDVIRRGDGTVERVDDDELEAAVAAGNVSPQLAEKARGVAEAVERAFRSE